MNILKIMLLPSALFLVLVGFGLWPGKTGKPYNNLLFNMHKLIALAAAILTGIRIFDLDPFSTFPNLAILLIGLAFVGVLGMFATGTLMSIKDEATETALVLHRIITGVIFLSFMFAIYLIINEQLKTL